MVYDCLDHELPFFMEKHGWNCLMYLLGHFLSRAFFGKLVLLVMMCPVKWALPAAVSAWASCWGVSIPVIVSSPKAPWFLLGASPWRSRIPLEKNPRIEEDVASNTQRVFFLMVWPYVWNENAQMLGRIALNRVNYAFPIGQLQKSRCGHEFIGELPELEMIKTVD